MLKNNSGYQHTNSNDHYVGHKEHHEFNYESARDDLHRHVHSDDEKKVVINRLARAAGHLEKVKYMILNDMDCNEVLIQIAAVRNAINNTGKLILKNHLTHCIVHSIEEKNLEEIRTFHDAIDKFIK